MIYYLDLNNKHKAQSPFKYGVIKHPMDNYPIKTFFLFMRTIPPKKKKRSNPFIATGWISKTLAGRDGPEGFQGHWLLVWIAYAEILDLVWKFWNRLRIVLE